MIENHIKWTKTTFKDHNYWLWENWKKFSEKFSDFGGDDGPSSRFFERAPTFPNFLRPDSDRPSFVLQFEPYDDLGVAWGKKLLRNYEKFMAKS